MNTQLTVPAVTTKLRSESPLHMRQSSQKDAALTSRLNNHGDDGMVSNASCSSER